MELIMSTQLQTKTLTSYDKFTRICSVLNNLGIKYKKHMQGGIYNSGARFVIEYNAKNSEYIINSILHIQNQFQAFGEVQNISIHDTLNYFEQNERLLRMPQSVIGLRSISEVQNVSPVTHGHIVVDVLF